MRKNSPRKWLHAILDLLPVLILPIFALAVRSDNNFQPMEVQAQEYKAVDFNQNLNEYGYDSDLGELSYNNGNYTYTYNYTFTGTAYSQTVYSTNEIEFKYGNKYLLKFNVTDSFTFRTLSANLFLNVNSSFNNYIYNCEYNEISRLYFGKYNVVSGDSFTFKFLQLFNLTQMFGEGNEPTIEQFNSWYPNEYYDYTLSHKELLNVGTTTYSDTDVGSQMVYTLYNATDKYFNFNNVFNFGQIYDWFVLNIFNGNVNLVFPVVWQIVLYEFIMDLVFLIYALFMFFIDFCTNLIDRFHVKCSGGK